MACGMNDAQNLIVVFLLVFYTKYLPRDRTGDVGSIFLSTCEETLNNEFFTLNPPQDLYLHLQLLQQFFMSLTIEVRHLAA